MRSFHCTFLALFFLLAGASQVAVAQQAAPVRPPMAVGDTGRDSTDSAKRVLRPPVRTVRRAVGRATVTQGRNRDRSKPRIGSGLQAVGQCQGDACGGGDPTYGVVVSPNAGSASYQNNLSGLTTTFTVINTGSTSATFSISCSSTGSVTCSGVSPSTLSLGTGEDGQGNVTATFSTGAVAASSLTVTATGSASGNGTLPVSVTANPTPAVSLSPHNPGYQSVGACVASCFDLLFGHSMPAFYTMDQPRSFGIVYNSATAKPTPVVFADVSVPSGIQRLATYSIQLQNTATSAFLTLLNGANVAYYTARPGQTLRLAAAFDAAANGLSTGWVPVNVVVTANYSSYGNATTSTATRILIDNESGSALGAGVTVAGLQRIYFKSGSDAVAITEGGGSIAYYNRACPTCTFAVPGGSTASLTYLGNNWGPDSTKYERKYLDGTIVGFRFDGRMRNIRDRFGNKTLFTWTDTLLTRVTFPKNKSITLAYTSVGGLTKLSTATDAGGRITRYTIDATRRLTGIMDPDSVSQTLGYAGSSLVPTTLTDRGGNSSTVAYDGSNRVISATGPSVPLYDGTSGQPVGQQKGLATLVWQPAIAGTAPGAPKAAIRADTIRATTTDPMGRVTSYELDRFGQPIRVRNPSNLESFTSRDSMGRVTLARTPRGHQVGYTYIGYLLYQTYDYLTGITTKYYYNARNDIDSITGGPAKIVNYYHDGTKGPAGALIATRVGGELTGLVHFPNAAGQDTSVYSYDSGNWVYYPQYTDRASARTTYDPTWGNTAAVRDQISRTSTTHFDGFGRPDTLTNPMGKKSTMTYDILGRVVSSRDPQGRVVARSYDTRGILQRVVDPKGQVYRWRHNAIGQLVAQFDLADTLRADSSYYDLGGALRKVRTRSGDLIQLSYDAQGRLTQRSATGMTAESVRFANDGAYQVLDNGVAYDSVNFDVAGRPTTSFERIMGTAVTHRRTYDVYSRLTGRMLTSGLDSSAATYTYTPRGQFSTVCVSGLCASPPDGQVELGTTGYTFNPSGTPWGRQIERWITPYTYPVDYYMERGMPLPLFGATDSAQVDAISSAWSVQSRVIQDESGNPYRREQWQAGQSSDVVEIFGYDSAGQLLTVADSATASNRHEIVGFPRYTYDQAGNRTDEGLYPFISSGSGNRYTLFHGWRVYYDLNGRMTARAQTGDSLSYSWNALGKLIEVKRNGASLARFGYDAAGRRVWKAVGADTTRFYHDGGILAFDVSENGRVQQEYAAFPATGFIYGIKNSTWSGIILDEQYTRSTLRVVDYATGHTEIKKFSYSPYGVSIPDSGKIVRQRFAGTEYDQESGIYLMGARYYDPLLGRFLSEDPIGILGGLNLYTYAANNPISFRDPSGLDPDPRCDPGDGGAGLPPEACYQQGGDPCYRGANGQWVCPPLCVGAGCDRERNLQDYAYMHATFALLDAYASQYMTYGVQDGGTAPAEVQVPAPCGDSQSLRALGMSGEWAIGDHGKISSAGTYAAGGEGGTFITDGIAIGLGGGVGWMANVLGTRGSFNGVGYGFCVSGIIATCVTVNSAGFNASLSFGPSVGAYLVKTNTTLIPQLGSCVQGRR